MRRLPQFDGSRGSPANPILAGQHPEYLVKQLTEFKSGKRANPVMQGMAATLATDADVKNVAAFYAAKSAKPRLRHQQGHRGQGEKIWRGGIAERRCRPAPAATAPRAPASPRSTRAPAGQHASYTEASCSPSATARAKNNAQMTGVVTAGMTEADIKAVADYVAGLH